MYIYRKREKRGTEIEKEKGRKRKMYLEKDREGVDTNVCSGDDR